jgi:amidase
VLADQARADADEAQRRLDEGEAAPLLGVPLVVKDNVDIAGELTCHGTGAVTRRAERDSEIVRRLRAAGAVIVGKTHLPELAMWGQFTESETYGPTRNPWNLDRATGGSSGGTAAAVAAGIVGGGQGSDGGASIRVPAGLCGVYGIKPQRDRVRRWAGPVPRRRCWRCRPSSRRRGRGPIAGRRWRREQRRALHRASPVP